MAAQRACILHLRGKSKDEIKAFDDHTWLKVKTVLTRRHTSSKDSKYFGIQLPDEHDSSIGYHKQCYKDFTAFSTANVAQDCTSSSMSSHVLRSSVDHPQNTSTGLFDNKCLFCNSFSKSLGKGNRELVGRCETDEAEKKIKEAAEVLQDNPMLARLGGVDMKAKEVRYHHSCRRSYIGKARSRIGDHTAKSSRLTDLDAAFESLRDHIDVALVSDEGAELLTSLHSRFMVFLGEDVATFSARSLADKIMKAYPDKLNTCCINTRRGIVIYNARLSEEAAIRRAHFDEHSVQEAAFYLRSLILKMQRSQDDLPEPITVEALRSGQGPPPDDVLAFFRVLYTDSSKPSGNEHIERLVQSVSDDVLFTTTRARSKPGKYLCMGLGLKSMTGSRKILEMMNRFGHCISYHTTERLETELATEISNRNHATPDGMNELAGLCTSLAWDNYDELTETLSGRETLHDTVGICYQNESEL